MQELKKKLQSFFPYKRKKAIEDWDFILVFQEYYQQEIEMILDSIRCRDVMEWTVIKHKQQKQSLFLLRFKDQVVVDMAHELKILKKKNKKSYKLSLKDLNSTIYTMGSHHPTNAYNYLCYIRARLYPKNKEIYEQEQYSAFNKDKIDQYIPIDKSGELFTEEEKLRTKYHYLLTYSEQIGGSDKQYEKQTREPFAQLMKHPGFVENVPIQKVSQYRPLILGSLKDYLGPNIDCYFDFVTFFQKWLWFPLIVGLLTAGVNYYYSYTVDNSPVDFFYAWAVMIWSILFITRWQEVQAWQKVKETPGNSEIWSEHQEIVSRRGMQKHISPVTGRAQYFLSMKDRFILKFASEGVFISITLITMVFMVLSLNLRGFIDPQHKLFYSEFLSNLAAPGGMFDANTNWGQIPNILHVVITNGFDEMVYRPLAKKLAKFQRHRSTKGYQNSIIIKYFIYEFLITFADLFYIAFVRFDIEGLRQQLFSLFFIDIVRRLVAESLIPWLKKTHRSRSVQKNYEQSTLTLEEQLEKGAILEVDKEPYEQFDDYLEIITNFGYLVMISSCFPMAPLLILIAHQVQLLQDRYKIVHIFKRKLPQHYVGMGRWKNIIVFLCYVSIITNIMLFAFSSEQVSSIFPKMYEGSKDLIYGNTDMQTLLGGAATRLFQSMISIGDQTASGSSNVTNAGAGWDFNPFDQDQQQQEERSQYDFLGGLGKVTTEDTSAQIKNIKLDGLLGLNPSENEEDIAVPGPDSTFQLHNFNAPDKDSQVTFITVLFFIEHFFLILFIVLRDLLKKRKSEADIFLERRAYKRKIKKNLPKDILALVTAGMLINKYFRGEDATRGTDMITKIIGKISDKTNTNKQAAQKKTLAAPQSQKAKKQKIESNLEKKESEMSGDTFLMQEGDEQEKRKSQVRDLLLGSLINRKDE